MGPALDLIRDALDPAVQTSLRLPRRLAAVAETHAGIVSRLLPPVQRPAEQGGLIVLGGGPLSGKSTYLHRIAATAEKSGMAGVVAAVNPSAMKFLIPEYALLAGLYREDNPHRKAALEAGISPAQLDDIGRGLYGFFEEEKELLLQSAVAAAVGRGAVVVLEHHLDSFPAAQKLVAAAGGRAALVAPDVTIPEMFARGRAREAATGKWFMTRACLSHHKKFEENWHAYVALFAAVLRSDNNGVPGDDAPVAVGVRGKLAVTDPAAYARMREKRHLLWPAEKDDAQLAPADVTMKMPVEKAPTVVPLQAALGMLLNAPMEPAFLRLLTGGANAAL